MKVTPEVEAFMLAKYEGTDLTAFDVLQIGASLLDTVGMTLTLGHTSPAHTLDYTDSTGSIWTDVIRDYTAWVSRRKGLAPGCEERLRALVGEGGWQRSQLNGAASVLMEKQP